MVTFGKAVSTLGVIEVTTHVLGSTQGQAVQLQDDTGSTVAFHVDGVPRLIELLQSVQMAEQLRKRQQDV